MGYQIKFKMLLISFIFTFNCYSQLTKINFNVLEKIYTDRTEVSLNSLLQDYRINKNFIKKISKIINKESKKYNLDPIFIASLIFAESSFRANAVSRVGAIGLMQIMPPTGAMIAEILQVKLDCSSRLFDPEINIKFGVWYINHLLELFNDPIIAITAYNFGPGNVNKMLKKYSKFPKYPYLFKVVGYYNKLQNKASLIEDIVITDYEKVRKVIYRAMNF